MRALRFLLICAILSAVICAGTAEEVGNIPSIRETMQTEQTTVTPFSFRNGIGWNMST